LPWGVVGGASVEEHKRAFHLQREAELNQRYRAGADIGGTFTDLIVVDQQSGRFSVGKVLTTPDDPSRAVEDVLTRTLQKAGVPAAQLRHLIHGTTLVTNAVIERKGARTALMTTAGFRDSIEIARESRYDLYDLMLEAPRPLVPRYLRFDIPQRTLADGSCGQPLDREHVRQLTRELQQHGIQAIAVCFLHSFTCPDDEQAARAAIQEVAPDMRVSLSCEVVPEIREFERASTTIANVYVQQLVEDYLRQLESRLASIGFCGNFFLMLSSGGVATVDTTIRFPVRLLESGPAAGALAASHCGVAAGMPDLISFDMGGTTAKICVIEDGQPLLAHEFEVDRIYRFKRGSGLPIKLPVIELIEIGTGGGSMARIDSLGLLKVGPESAGADPGPVCYGRGGVEPTVTDANLILGYLDPDYFLGGEMTLDKAACREAIRARIAGPLGLSVEEAAWGIHQIANENMANAARVHALERGKDPRRFPLFAFGGAGPVHAWGIAASLGSPLLIAPRGAGVLSTVGFLTAPLAFDFVRSWPVTANDVDWDRINQLICEMEQQGRELLLQSGVAESDIDCLRHVDMRFAGQGHEIRVALPSGTLHAGSLDQIEREFDRVYRELYERSGPPVPVEFINWRVVSRGPRPDVYLKMQTGRSAARTAEACIKGERQVWVPQSGGYRKVHVYDRYALLPGMRLQGPAIIEERESTVVAGPGADCHIDEHFNLRITPEHTHVA
jgi:N-methylhydantoinase A